ncbi:antitoxin [Georgenia wutianyii]|uniref:Antitoxin n=1 Tax=Georgenia wutianyii TaxID=2585135 RepID=A0ABX5VPL2_9MICO|nr:antitoxin [Georgenia wutianyii]QDB80442.1 antitoxin [Georgenia wutianyii]
MGIGDKAKDLMGGDKAEQATDTGLDKAADAAGEKTGSKHADKVDQARETGDEKLGNE